MRPALSLLFSPSFTVNIAIYSRQVTCHPNFAAWCLKDPLSRQPHNQYFQMTAQTLNMNSAAFSEEKRVYWAYCEHPLVREIRPFLKTPSKDELSIAQGRQLTEADYRKFVNEWHNACAMHYTNYLLSVDGKKFKYLIIPWPDNYNPNDAYFEAKRAGARY